MSETIAVLGGTGPQGRGLAMRWARVGYDVFIGSRHAERGESVAAELSERCGARIRGSDNGSAAAAADRFVVLTVPYAAHVATIESVREHLAGKVLVDVTVPLAADNPRRMDMPPEGSATEQAQALLGPDIPVVAAFQNVSASVLEDLSDDIACDILVCGDHKASKDAVIGDLVETIGCVGYNVGLAESARCVEALTSILIRLNISKAYPHLKHAGVRITGD